MANGEWGNFMSGPVINSYKDLHVWQEAMALAESCYRVTRNFPKGELFGLTSQIRRAASSIAANIAEGHGRESTGSFIQFLRIAQGSLKEVETHLILSSRIEIMTARDAEPLIEKSEKLGKMLRSLIRSLQDKA
jgi:four helix bundle protein